MTDTTEIAAQLAKRILHYADMAELTSEKSSVFGADLIRLTGETITNLLGKLEAERQQAERAEAAVPPTVSFFMDGIAAAANWVDQSREAFEHESGQIDPDTGTFEFGNNADAEYSSVLFDVAEGIRQLHPNAASLPTEKTFRDVAPNDVVLVGKDWFRVRYITRHGDCTSLHLQREAEKLHPLKQNDVIHLSVENAVPLFIAVKGE